jgi:hypothetical protein
VCSACRISDSDRCGGRSGDAIRVRVWSWRGVSVFAGLLDDIALGRPQAARRRFLCVLCVLCIPCLVFLCLPRIPCFLFVNLHLSCRVVPLHDICRVERPDGKKGTHGPGLPQRDVDYFCAALRQLDVFIILSISRVKEWVSGPP